MSSSISLHLPLPSTISLCILFSRRRRQEEKYKVCFNLSSSPVLLPLFLLFLLPLFFFLCSNSVCNHLFRVFCLRNFAFCMPRQQIAYAIRAARYLKHVTSQWDDFSRYSALCCSLLNAIENTDWETCGTLSAPVLISAEHGNMVHSSRRVTS